MSRQRKVKDIKKKKNPTSSKPEDSEAEVTISMLKLKAIMKTIATEVFDEKKEKLREEIEDECEYQVYI